MQLSSRLLGEYTLEVSYAELPNEVVDAAKRFLLDSLGCCIGGFTSPPSKALRQAFGDRPGDTTIVGDGRSTSPEYAALLNAAMVRYLDFNDCYISGESVCHPSDHIPALLSIAESEGADGQALIEAIVVAYEIECRGVDTGAFWDNGFDYVTWGLYSTAAAAGKLMGLSADEIVNAIGIAGTSSNGLLVSRLGDVSMWKGVAHPYACHSAIQACQMAACGMTGPLSVFEGEGGIFEVVADGPIEFEGIGGRDGADYRITRSNVKPFACGYFMQSPITAVLDIVEEHGIDHERIEAIEIEEFDQAVQVLAGPEKWSTDLTRETADHSIPYSIAVAILDGAVGPDQYESDRLEDPNVHDLMAKVTVEESESLNRHRRESPGDIPAVARLTVDGDVHERRVDYPRGHWKEPMSDAELEAKVRRLMDGLLTDSQIDRVIGACRNIEAADDLGPLLSSLQV